MADAFPLANVGGNPAAQFANKAKSVGNKVRSSSTTPCQKALIGTV